MEGDGAHFFLAETHCHSPPVRPSVGALGEYNRGRTESRGGTVGPENRLLATALAALTLAAAQEPEPVVIKLSKKWIDEVYLSPDGRQALATRGGGGQDFGGVYLLDVAE